jgi:hypothetical protein
MSRLLFFKSEVLYMALSYDFYRNLPDIHFLFYRNQKKSFNNDQNGFENSLTDLIDIPFDTTNLSLGYTRPSNSSSFVIYSYSIQQVY